MLLLPKKDQEQNNPLASFATYHSRRMIGHERTASRSRLCPDGPCVHLSSSAYMPSCIRPEVRLPLHQRVLCSDCFKKNVLCLAQVVFSYFVLHRHNRSKIPLVITTKVTHLRSLLCSDSQMELTVQLEKFIQQSLLSCPKTE